MKDADLLPNDCRVRKGLLGTDDSYGRNGAFRLSYKNTKMKIIVSDGEGWDHVSVSCEHRCPTWQEMAYVKKVFFMPDECVVQFHPPESEYVNNHPNCLHMWKQQGVEIALPPKVFV